jgi:putative membrane protein
VGRGSSPPAGSRKAPTITSFMLPSLKSLPALNAVLNTTSAVLIVLAYRAIRRLEIERHRALMLSAATTSALFLVSYITYHAQVGSVRFTAPGIPRAIYFAVLSSHTVLAVVTLPLVLRTLYLGLKRRDDRHRRIARWTLPIWLYVSVTGVVVYLMLYQLYPPAAVR